MKEILLLLLIFLSNSKFLTSDSKLNIEIPDEEMAKTLQNDLAESNSVINIKCLWVNKMDVYSLQPLQNGKEDYTYNVNNATNKQIIFNFCQDVKPYSGNSSSLSTVLLKTSDGNSTTYTRLSGTIDPENSTEKNTWTNESFGLRISLTSGEKCIGNNFNYLEYDEENSAFHKTILEIECDANITGGDFLKTLKVTGLEDGQCEHTIRFKSVYGCKLNSTFLLKKVLEDYKFIFSVLLVLIGFCLCFYGSKFIIITTVLITAVVVSAGGAIGILSFFPKLIVSEKQLLIVMGVLALVGIALGFALTKAVKIFVFVLGAVLGYSIGMFVYQIIQPLISFDPTQLYYVTLILCSLICGIIALCILKVALILGTAFFGGYLMARGIGNVLGHYPDEALIIELIKNREFEQLAKFQDYWVYAYLGGWLIISLIGIMVQCSCTKENDEDYKKK